MSTQILCTTNIGIQTVRKDKGLGAEVRIETPLGHRLHTIKFKNVPLQYDSQYLNWENYNCCEGWTVDRDYLNHAVQNNRKLYAGILRKDLDDLIPELEALELCYGYESQHPRVAYICKPGCVADYIDLDVILDDYEQLGYEFDEDDLEYLNQLTHHPMSDFSNSNNPYSLDYANPKGDIEGVFVGLLLGYTLESTYYFLG